MSTITTTPSFLAHTRSNATNLRKPSPPALNLTKAQAELFVPHLKVHQRRVSDDKEGIELASLKPRKKTVASPPSPLFSIPKDAEPFPAIDDAPFEIEQEAADHDSAHCMLHCTHKVCVTMTNRASEAATCQCPPPSPTSLQSPKPLDKSTPAVDSEVPSIVIPDEYTDLPIHTAPFLTPNPSSKIHISGPDAHALIEGYLAILHTAEHFTHLSSITGLRPAAKLAYLFKGFTQLYTKRKTASNSIPLSITAAQLELEFRLYATTALCDWAKKYPEDIDIRVLKEDWRFYIDAVSDQESRAGEVAEFLGICMEDLIALMLWRTQVVQAWEEEKEREEREKREMLEEQERVGEEVDMWKNIVHTVLGFLVGAVVGQWWFGSWA